MSATAAAAPPIRVALADDEPDARDRLASLLAGRAGLELTAVCRDGDEAVAALRALAAAGRPAEVLLLDVQMPELDGFGVLEALLDDPGADAMPAAVFVTAHDAYALRAFDVSAVDYLLKPFDRERFDRALARAVARAADRRAARASSPAASPASGPLASAPTSSTPELRALAAWLDERRASDAGRAAPARRFVVRASGKLYFVRAADVDWIDAEGNYVRLHARGELHLVRDTLTGVEARLDPATFVRVHRSAIINIDRVAALEPYFHGEYVITMRDGSKLTSSRSYSGRLRELLG